VAERLQKFLARAGVASRRRAEELMVQGRVAVNNQIVRELGTKVEPGRDLVTVDGRLVEGGSERHYYVLYKPPGVVTTLSDPQGRPTISAYTSKLPGRQFPVGRLDYDAEGALLLTDDGDLALRLTHPRFQVPRIYLTKVKGAPALETLEKLRGGVRLEDGMAKPQSVEVFERAEKNTWLAIIVTEGRPHLVKRMCAAIGHPVVRLFRPAQGGVSVARMRPGQVRPLTAEEVKAVDRASRGEERVQVELRLPARQHGRAPEDRAPKPPRFRARNAARR
jgi:23S rRNA pseudouridine2605 synthase